jgi:hypothetical protein
LVVIQALASFVAGPLAIALLLFYSAALVMSVVELVYLGMHLNYTNGIQKPMLEAFIGSPSLINRIQDYIAYGDSINMQYFSQRIDEGLSLPQMVSLVNEFYDKTDNFGSLYFHNAPIYAALNS